MTGPSLPRRTPSGGWLYFGRIDGIPAQVETDRAGEVIDVRVFPADLPEGRECPFSGQVQDIISRGRVDYWHGEGARDDAGVTS